MAQEPARIKVNVHLVNVTFSVRNEAGLSPADLTKNDFEVFEDGVRQNISFFSRSADLPLTLGLVVDASGSHDAIYYAASEKLADGTNGRKALIVFSDGEDNSSAHHMLDAIEEAQVENIPLFWIRYTEHRKHGKITARNKYGTA